MRTAAIPVETKVRELDGKLWLALNLVERGFRVAVGRLAALNSGLDLLKPDIYLGKSAVFRERREALFRNPWRGPRAR